MSDYVPTAVFVWIMVLVAAAIVALLLLAEDDGGEDSVVVRPSPAATTVVSSPGAVPVVQISMVPTIMFDREEIRVAPGEVTFRANNTDDGILHNFAVYTSEEEAGAGADAIAKTEICAAPCVEEVTFTAMAGEFFFRCDVHPTQMTGTLVVQE